MSDDIILSDYNSRSNRWAIFEDDGITGWFYLTEPNEKKPQSDCWIYNRVQAPKEIDKEKFGNTPPPATEEYLKRGGQINLLDHLDIKIIWSSNGNAIALLINGNPFGYITSEEKRGYSKNLIKNGPWGNLFNEERYFELFIEGRDFL